MAFYADMQAMVKDLLKPDTDGGLGQGPLTIRRVTGSALIDPAQPWLGSTYTTADQTVNQVATGKNEYRTGETLIGVDMQIMTTVPPVLPEVGQEVLRDGVALGRIVRCEVFPPTGTPVFCTLWILR